MPFRSRHPVNPNGEGPYAAAGKMHRTDHRASYNHGSARKRDADKKHSNGGGGDGNSGRKRKKAPDHPFVEEFIESLDNSTVSITASIVKSISDIYKIRLSRIAAATALSQTYIDSANSSAEKFARLSILSGGFERELAATRAFVAAKQNNIDGLCRDYREITDEIVQLQHEALTISPMEDLARGGPLVAKEFEEEEDAGEAYLKDAAERCRGVERRWGGRMEASERKFENDAIKRRQLAAAAMV